VLDLAHHAFSRAINIGLVIIGLLFIPVRSRPIEFQAVRIVLKNEINLLDGDGFLPARLLIVIVHFIDETPGLAFLPNAEGKFKTAGGCPCVSAGPSVIEPSKTGLILVID